MDDQPSAPQTNKIEKEGLPSKQGKYILSNRVNAFSDRREQRAMYQVELTASERAAFGWVGNRYSNGNEMADLLRSCLPENEFWWFNDTVHFNIPEHVSWQIRDLAEQENFMWPCFAPTLAHKMQDFVDEIV